MQTSGSASEWWPPEVTTCSCCPIRHMVNEAADCKFVAALFFRRLAVPTTEARQGNVSTAHQRQSVLVLHAFVLHADNNSSACSWRIVCRSSGRTSPPFTPLSLCQKSQRVMSHSHAGEAGVHIASDPCVFSTLNLLLGGARPRTQHPWTPEGRKTQTRQVTNREATWAV
jgi:hypothetical protein